MMIGLQQPNGWCFHRFLLRYNRGVKSIISHRYGQKSKRSNGPLMVNVRVLATSTGVLSREKVHSVLRLSEQATDVSSLYRAVDKSSLGPGVSPSVS